MNDRDDKAQQDRIIELSMNDRDNKAQQDRIIELNELLDRAMNAADKDFLNAERLEKENVELKARVAMLEAEKAAWLEARAGCPHARANCGECVG